MDPKYNLAVAIVAIAAFIVSAFSLGQVMGYRGVVDVVAQSAMEVQADAAVRRSILNYFRPGTTMYTCTYPNGATIMTTHPSSITSFSYNTGSTTATITGASLTATCVATTR